MSAIGAERSVRRASIHLIDERRERRGSMSIGSIPGLNDETTADGQTSAYHT